MREGESEYGISHELELQQGTTVVGVFWGSLQGSVRLCWAEEAQVLTSTAGPTLSCRTEYCLFPNGTEAATPQREKGRSSASKARRTEETSRAVLKKATKERQIPRLDHVAADELKSDGGEESDDQKPITPDGEQLFGRDALAHGTNVYEMPT